MLDCFCSFPRRVRVNGCTRDRSTGPRFSQRSCGGAGGVTERALGTWSTGKLVSICYCLDTSARRQGVLTWLSSNVRVH